VLPIRVGGGRIRAAEEEGGDAVEQFKWKKTLVHPLYRSGEFEHCANLTESCDKTGEAILIKGKEGKKG